MSIYGELAAISAVIVYIVDLSGFTESWRRWLAAALKVRELRPLPPFDCSKCAVWWACLLYALCVGRLTWGTVGFAALMSLMSGPMGAAMELARVWANEIITKLFPK